MRPSSNPLLWILIVFSLAVVGCAGGEKVTLESLQKAKQTWKSAQVRDYDLEWMSSGLREARYRVKVRGGVVQTVEMIQPDGRSVVVQPAEPRFFGVDGLFTIIADELALCDSATPFGQPKGTAVVLNFTPDATYGYPRRYRRDVVGSPAAVAIDVLRFEPRPTPVDSTPTKPSSTNPAETSSKK